MGVTERLQSGHEKIQYFESAFHLMYVKQIYSIA